MPEFLHRLIAHLVDAEEREAAPLYGGVICPSGTHGDMRDGEVVPGDLPCPTCGAAL